VQSFLKKKAVLNASLIDRRRQGGFAPSITDPPFSRLQGLADNLGSTVDTIKDREMNLLQTRERTLDKDMDRTILILIISSLAGVAVLILAKVLVVFQATKWTQQVNAVIEG